LSRGSLRANLHDGMAHRRLSRSAALGCHRFMPLLIPIFSGRRDRQSASEFVHRLSCQRWHWLSESPRQIPVIVNSANHSFPGGEVPPQARSSAGDALPQRCGHRDPRRRAATALQRDRSFSVPSARSRPASRGIHRRLGERSADGQGILAFCNSPLMNSIEAYIQFEDGLISEDGRVSNEATRGFVQNYMSELHGFIARVYTVLLRNA
jgi:hypothetical protein